VGKPWICIWRLKSIGTEKDKSRKRFLEEISTSPCMKNKQIMKNTGNFEIIHSAVFSQQMVKEPKFHTRDWQTRNFDNTEEFNVNTTTTVLYLLCM